MKKKKIVWITSPSPNIYVPMYSYLGRKNPSYDLIMILPEEAKRLNIKEDKFRITYLKIKDYAKVTFFPWLFLNIIKGKKLYDFPANVVFQDLKKTLYKENPDLIIIMEFYNLYALDAARWCKKTKTKMIMQTEMQRFHSPYAAILIKLYMRIFDNLLFGQAKKIQCWSVGSEKFMKCNLDKYKNKIVLLPGPIDTKIFHRVNVIKQNKKIRLLTIARMLPYKRYDTLLKATHWLKNNSDLDFTLSIIGSGPAESEIKEMIKKLKIKDKVVFLQKTPREYLKKVYSEHDIFILPSYNEAIGMVVPEAMACGMPVVVSNTAGAATYVVEGENGYLFKTLHHEDLAQKILLLKDKKKRELFGKKAEEHIKKNFSLEAINKRFQKHVNESLMSEKPRV